MCGSHVGSCFKSLLPDFLYLRDMLKSRNRLYHWYEINLTEQTRIIVSCSWLTLVTTNGTLLWLGNQCATQNSWLLNFCSTFIGCSSKEIQAGPPYAHHSILKLCHSMEMVKPCHPARETCWTGQQCPSPVQLVTSIGRHDHCQNWGGHGSWQSRWTCELAIPPE